MTMPLDQAAAGEEGHDKASGQGSTTPLEKRRLGLFDCLNPECSSRFKRGRRGRYQYYCSSHCAATHNARINDFLAKRTKHVTCRNPVCNAIFLYFNKKSGKTRIYCSKTCLKQHTQRRLNFERNTPHICYKQCRRPSCNNTFLSSRRGSVQAYCAKKCSKAHRQLIKQFDDRRNVILPEYYRQRTPEEVREVRREYQSLMMDYGYSKAIRFYLRYSQDNLCALCMLDLGDGPTEIDHRRPIMQGGSNSLSNLQLTHPLCNSLKGGGK